MPVRSLELPSFAKINLCLRILGKRDDGFHKVFTVLQTISLHDRLLFEVAGNEILLSCDSAEIPKGSTNIIVRAAGAVKAKFGVGSGLRIDLEKRIPLPGGLGGGSSNAAMTLLALNKLWEINAGIDDLAEIAAGLGTDVPFFLYGGTAIGTGTGSTIEPIEKSKEFHAIVVTPDVDVSTAEAYARLNAMHLTSGESERILLNYRFDAGQGFEMVNDIEKTVFAAYPEIERVKNRLLELGAASAMMSGSGASVFGIFDNEETRQTALKALGQEPNWRSFAVATISRNEYRDALKEVL